MRFQTLSLAALLVFTVAASPATPAPETPVLEQVREGVETSQFHASVQRAIDQGIRDRAARAEAARLDAIADVIAEEERLAEEARQREEEQRRAEELAAQEAAAQAAQEAAQEDEQSASPAEEEPVAPAQTSGVPWDAIARCESGYGGEPNWSINTGNGYYGGLQFDKSSWDWAGGPPGYPHEHSREVQIATAEKLLAIHPAGLGAWPACTKQLGLR